MFPTARRRLIDLAMPDGVELATSVSLPHEDFRGPVLLLRSPYPFPSFAEATMGLELAEALASGFGVVRQDTRGRGGSGGVTGFLGAEAADSHATHEWIVEQPWSDGRIATIGVSYLSRIQLLAGDAHAPAPIAMIPALAGLDSDATWKPGGVRSLALVGQWLDLLAQSEPRLLTADQLHDVQALLARQDALAIYDAVFDPGHPAHRLMAPLMPLLRDEPGEHARLTARPPRVPSLHFTGWFDFCLTTTVDAWHAACTGGDGHHLIVGPWTHVDFGGQLHGRSFPGGDAASWGLAIQQLDFLRAAVDGSPPLLPVAQVYVTGADEWRTYPTWPPAGVERSLFPTADGLRDAPAEADVLELRSTAAAPVPSIGGIALGVGPEFGSPHLAGPADLMPLLAREDVIVLRSAPLERDLELAGTVRLDVAVETDVEPPGLVCKLAETAPDGTVRVLTDGVRAVPAGADGPSRVVIELAPLHHRVRAGRALVVLVAATELPRYHLGLLGDGRLRLHVGGAEPARLTLPVVSA